MEYRLIVENQESIKKLTGSNAVPWEAALELADFAEDIERASEKYNKAHNAIQFKYGKMQEKQENEMLTPTQLESRETEIQELLCMQTDEIRVPKLEEDVFKKLYKLKKTEEDQEVTIFTISDLKAFKVLGLFAEE